MKKNKRINISLVIFGLCALAVSCSDDDGGKNSAGFAGIASSYVEGKGDITLTIPFVNGSFSQSDIVIDGSATPGEDYEMLGVTEEGVEIKLLDDSECEDFETIRLRINGAPRNANSMHTVTIASNADEPYTTAELAGTYTIVADEWEDFHEGDEVTVERVDDNNIRIIEYPATTVDHAGLVITITNLATGAATVVSQSNGSYNASGTQATTTTGSGTVSKCNGLDLNLNFTLPCCGTSTNNHLVLVKN
jgi:hypothetical protein